MDHIIFDEFKRQVIHQKNLLFSPFGFDLVFRFLCDYTYGETKEELSRLFPIGEENKFYNLLNLVESNLENNSNTDIYNKIEIEYGKSLSPEKLIKIKSDYSKIGIIDYLESKDPEYEFQIRNTLRFEEEWFSEFDEMEHPNIFYQSNGKKNQSKFIRQFLKNERNQVSYYSNNKFSAIQIPLKSNRFTFEIYLPNQGEDLKSFVNDLSIEKLNSIDFKLPKYLEVVIPEFELESTLEINSGFELSKIYSPSFDFKAIFNDSIELFIKRIVQINTIKVSKSGVQGASETIFYGGIGSLSKTGEHILFEADRPFMYLLKEKKFGTCLFIGTFEEPPKPLLTSDSISTAKQIEQFKTIRKFKPFIHQLPTKARAYLGLECLNNLVKEQNVDMNWAKNIIEDILKYIENDDLSCREKVKEVNFESIEYSGYYFENDYFSRKETEKLREKFPDVTSMLNSICNIIRYANENIEEDLFSDLGYYKTFNVVELCNKVTGNIPNLEIYKSCFFENSFNEEEFLGTKNKVEYLYEI